MKYELGEQILRDKAFDKQLFEEGFVIVPFLAEPEIKALTEYFHSIKQGEVAGIYASAHIPDKDFRIKTNNFLAQQYARAIDLYFKDCQALGGSYIVKGPGEYGELKPHQDWNIVDESQHRSFNIWTPLVDVREENGAIFILKKSHNKLPIFRGTNIPCAFQDIYPLVWPKMVELKMHAGEALIYDHRLLHASKQNKSAALRLATVFSITSNKASMKYYYKNGDQIEEYDCHPAFYQYQNPFEGPIGLKLNRSFKDENIKLDKDRFAAIFEGKSKGFFRKLGGMFQQLLGNHS